MDFCLNIRRSKSPEMKTEEEVLRVNDLLSFVATTYKVTKAPAPNIWSRYTDTEEEGTFVDYYTGRTVSLPSKIFGPGQPNGGHLSNCLTSIYTWNGRFNDEPCLVDESVRPLRCACQSKHQPMLKLRGLCAKSFLDTYYVLKNEEESGQLVFYGLKRTLLVFDHQKLEWQASILGKMENTSGYSKAPKLSFLLGTHTWIIDKDSSACNRGKTYSLVLKLTGCEENEFTCKVCF